MKIANRTRTAEGGGQNTKGNATTDNAWTLEDNGAVRGKVDRKSTCTLCFAPRCFYRYDKIERGSYVAALIDCPLCLAVTTPHNRFACFTLHPWMLYSLQRASVANLLGLCHPKGPKARHSLGFLQRTLCAIKKNYMHSYTVNPVKAHCLLKNCYSEKKTSVQTMKRTHPRFPVCYISRIMNILFRVFNSITVK